MCCRYYLDKELLEELYRQFHGLPRAMQLPLGAAEVFPTDAAPALRAQAGGSELFWPRWGFAVPGRRSPAVNARAETAAARPLFAESFLHRRCLLPASRFFEWDAAPGKTKYAFVRADGAPLLLAGLWRPVPDGAQFTVLTAAANASMAPVHDRMPVLIAPGDADAYLADAAAAAALIAAPGPALARAAELAPGGGEQLYL